MKQLFQKKSKQPPAQCVAAFDELGFDYTLVFSTRRRSSEIVIRQATVSVRCPVGSQPASIHRWVIKKQHWIRTKLAQQKTQLDIIPPLRLADGATLPFCDEPLTVKITQAKTAKVKRTPGVLHIELGGRSKKTRDEQVVLLVKRWLCQEAEKLLVDQTYRQAETLDVEISEVKFRFTRSKWGHCTREGVIQYNPLILLAPANVRDYLVVHEVSHRVHHNHSRRFWQLVARQCPGYKAAEQWLSQYGQQLIL